MRMVTPRMAGPLPIPASSVQLTPQEVRRNFLCLVWKGSVFAMGWTEVMTVLQPLMVHYGASNTQIGIVQGVLIASLPGMFVSPWLTRRFRFKKYYLFVADALYLLPVGLIGLAVWIQADQWLGGPSAMVGLIVWLMMAGQIAAGFGGLPNQEFFASCIPMRLRGRLAGMSASVGGLLGIGASSIAVWVLMALPKPQAYGALLVLGWLLCQIADSAILFAKEKPVPVEASPKPWTAAMWRAFREDKRFVRLVIVLCFISPLMGQLAVFSTVFAFRDLKFEPKMAAWLAMSAAGARLALSPIAGWLTDSVGARRMLISWALAMGAGYAVLALFPFGWAVFFAGSLAAVGFSGFSGAMNALVAGIPRPEHRAGHFTLLGFCLVAANAVVPLAVGWLFDQTGYRHGFAGLAVATLVIAVGSQRLLRCLSDRPADYQ